MQHGGEFPGRAIQGRGDGVRDAEDVDTDVSVTFASGDQAFVRLFADASQKTGAKYTTGDALICAVEPVDKAAQVMSLTGEERPKDGATF